MTKEGYLVHGDLKCWVGEESICSASVLHGLPVGQQVSHNPFTQDVHMQTTNSYTYPQARLLLTFLTDKILYFHVYIPAA